MGFKDRARLMDSKDLDDFTENFSKENYIGKFQFGKFYRVALLKDIKRLRRDFVVKIWEASEVTNLRCNELRMANEIVLHRHEELLKHPGLVKLYGFCCDGEKVIAVYEMNAMDSVYNLISKDSFTWLQRIKVALGFARLLKFLHYGNQPYEPFVVNNIDAAHILIDEDYNPSLLDFSMVRGGIFPTKENNFTKRCSAVSCGGKLTVKVDVLAFGFLLLSLITKRVFAEEGKLSVPSVHELIWRKYESEETEYGVKEYNCSLVHKCLSAEPDYCCDDGCNILELAMKCISRQQERRPTMKQVVKHLLKLEVVKHHAHFLGVETAIPSQERAGSSN